MARTVPVYAFQAADGSTIRFAVDSDLWITNLTGDDGLDVEMTEQQSTGQTGKTITGQSVGSRSLTVTGSILRDLDANEALLKRLIRPKEVARWLKTATVVYTSFLYLLMYQLPAVDTGVGNQLPSRPPSMVAAVSTVRQYGYAAFSLN